MYEVKFKTLNNKKRLHVVSENSLSCLEAIDVAAKEYGDSLEEIFSVYVSTYKEVVRNDTDEDVDHKWYDVTAASVCADPESGKEKKLKYHLLIDAPDFDSAVEKTKDTLSQGYDMTTFSIKETDIIDVI